MAKAIIDEQNLTDIADAIRAKNGSADTYLPSEMATAIGDLPTPQTVTKGLVFSDYDSDGYPHKAEFVGTWTEIPNSYCSSAFILNSFSKNITSLTIPEGVTTIGDNSFDSCQSLEEIILPTSLQEVKTGAFKYCQRLKSIYFPSDIIFGAIGTNQQTFRFCYDLQSVVFGGQVDRIVQIMFNGTSKIELFDFSHCSTIPPLHATNALEHKSGCVIKVPSALLSTWQTTAVWQDLTNVVWQGV